MVRKIEPIHIVPNKLIGVWKDGTQVWRGEVDGITRVIYWNPEKQAKPAGLLGTDFIDKLLKKLGLKK